MHLFKTAVGLKLKYTDMCLACRTQTKMIHMTDMYDFKCLRSPSLYIEKKTTCKLKAVFPTLTLSNRTLVPVCFGDRVSLPLKVSRQEVLEMLENGSVLSRLF